MAIPVGVEPTWRIAVEDHLGDARDGGERCARAIIEIAHPGDLRGELLEILPSVEDHEVVERLALRDLTHAEFEVLGLISGAHRREPLDTHDVELDLLHQRRDALIARGLVSELVPYGLEHRIIEPLVMKAQRVRQRRTRHVEHARVVDVATAHPQLLHPRVARVGLWGDVPEARTPEVRVTQVRLPLARGELEGIEHDQVDQSPEALELHGLTQPLVRALVVRRWDVLIEDRQEQRPTVEPRPPVELGEVTRDRQLIIPITQRVLLVGPIKHTPPRARALVGEQVDEAASVTVEAVERRELLPG